MAIAAVLSPLLLMFGLKYGIVDWGRSYLMEDPRYSEIKLLASKSFEKDWFEQMRNRQDVDFVILKRKKDSVCRIRRRLPYETCLRSHQRGERLFKKEPSFDGTIFSDEAGGKEA